MQNIPDPIAAYDDYMDQLDKAEERTLRAEDKMGELLKMPLEDFHLLACHVGHDDTIAMVMQRVAEYLVDKEDDDAKA
ncbi:MAG: hypothetical protein KGI54_18700 [Pseudomonadota bacterium]|nr:hypothetical protein [Pseudomonadota bacterium]